MRLLIILVLLLVLAVALMMILRPSGPRVTRIERRIAKRAGRTMLEAAE